MKKSQGANIQLLFITIILLVVYVLLAINFEQIQFYIYLWWIMILIPFISSLTGIYLYKTNKSAFTILLIIISVLLSVYSLIILSHFLRA